MAADHAVLTQIAISKLRGTRPDAWDQDGRTLFEMAGRQAYPTVHGDALEAAWRDGLAAMKRDDKTAWDEYARARKDYGEVTSVGWDRVRLVSGQTDGDNFELHFNVDGVSCSIECTDIQLLDPIFILRKLVLYTAKDISCPFMGRKQLDAWRRNVVLPWLRSEAFLRTERQVIAEQVEDLIREYCAKTLDGDDDPTAWLQSKRAVVSQGSIYIPFTGLQEFVSKRAPNDLTKRAIKNALKRMGAGEHKKGKQGLRYQCLKLTELYGEDTHPGEAGRGQEHANSDDGTPPPGSRTDRALDELREEKRTRPDEQSGEGPATP